MPVTRSVLETSRPALKAGSCLDCPDCAGRCWSLLELTRLPETALNPRKSAS